MFPSSSRQPRLIYDLSLAEFTDQMTAWGEPIYRARQIWEGLYRLLWHEPDQFTNLPKTLRTRLAESFCFQPLTPHKSLTSKDGLACKTLFTLSDGQPIETVLMQYEQRNTLCISTQVGCAIGCVFCATGQMGYRRNLSSGEIVAQVMHHARLLQNEGQVVTNIVVMGMGEPFHNYENTMAAIDRLNDPHGFNLGARRFTISTVGLTPGIRRFTAEKRQVNLAISLHAADDDLRAALIPIAHTYPLAELLEACRQYVAVSKRRITFEWALIRDVNDSPQQARLLTQRLKGLLCHMNLIPLNPTSRYSGQPSSRQRAEAFRDILTQAGIPCTIRLRRGVEIQAGCGQLGNKTESEQQEHARRRQTIAS